MNERVLAGVSCREWGDAAGPAILLWPGLGCNSAYFAAIAPALPGRAAAVDHPGFGRSAPLDRYTSERLVELASTVADACGCWAMVAHSLGAYLAVGVAGDPPPGLRAVVLLDGGFMNAAAMSEIGMPVTSGREQLIAWMRANEMRFPDWETAIRSLATMIGGEPSPMLEAYIREVFVEVDGEICQPGIAPGDGRPGSGSRGRRCAHSSPACAGPDTLVASGQPADRRETREQAWRRFADSSTLIELHVADAWGHNAILQDSQASSRLIADWLERHR